jgi:erythromycin esterase-like protein
MNEVRDLTPLIQKLSRHRIVMLGEATHGTHEFYEWRRLISEWLIVKQGFNFIAVEGDWPDCQSIHRFVQGRAAESSAREVLEQFRRWPTWMWANTEIIRLMEWMKSHNSAEPGRRVGFHGLDVYSLFDSIQAVLKKLQATQPSLAGLARRRYSCFDSFHGDEIAYARSTLFHDRDCESDVTSMLQELLEARLRASSDEKLDLIQNARVIRNAEHYYRIIVQADEHSWNVRDRHMLETLDSLLEHYGPESRGIVWAHNTHIGDYRATDMAAAGMVNLGGIAREKYGEDQVALVGFGSYEGQVTASHAWDGPVLKLELPPARPGSLEESFHSYCETSGHRSFYLDLREHAEAFSQTRGHRAVGVVYDPRHERRGNYVPTVLSKRYDAFIHVDRTRALEPLLLPHASGELPETWPVGF